MSGTYIYDVHSTILSLHVRNLGLNKYLKLSLQTTAYCARLRTAAVLVAQLCLTLCHPVDCELLARLLSP